MKKTNNKGFTIVELVIVIAVIAILAAVLIPTFSSVIKKAKMSADQQYIRNINMILLEEEITDKAENIFEVRDQLKTNGLNSVNATSVGYTVVYDASINRCLLVNEETKNAIYPQEYVDRSIDNGAWVRLVDNIVGVNTVSAFNSSNAFLPTYQLKENITLTSDLTIVNQTGMGNFRIDLNGFSIDGSNSDFILSSDKAGEIDIFNGSISVKNYTVETPKAHIEHRSSASIVVAEKTTINTSNTSYILAGELRCQTAEFKQVTHLVKKMTGVLIFNTATVDESVSVELENNTGKITKVAELEEIKDDPTVGALKVGNTVYSIEQLPEAVAAINSLTADTTVKLLSNIPLGTNDFNSVANGRLDLSNNNNITITIDFNSYIISGTCINYISSGGVNLIKIENSKAKFVFDDSTVAGFNGDYSSEDYKAGGLILTTTNGDSAWDGCSYTPLYVISSIVDINDGRIIHDCVSGRIAYCIDSDLNPWGDSVHVNSIVTINGGYISGKNCDGVLRIDTQGDDNSELNKIEINNGFIYGDGCNCFYSDSYTSTYRTTPGKCQMKYVLNGGTAKTNGPALYQHYGNSSRNDVNPLAHPDVMEIILGENFKLYINDTLKTGFGD